MNFRLFSLLYLFALVAAALGAFGAAGLWAVLITLLLLAAVFQFPRLTPIEWLVTAGIVLAISLLILPATGVPSGLVHRSYCRYQLRALSIGLLNYQDGHGPLPPAVVVAGKNNDRHSWRTMLLPFLERQDVFDLYDVDEPWDGPNNSKLVATADIDEFICHQHFKQGEANYFAITGPNTAWSDEQGVKVADITDGADSTILLIEAAGRGVAWAEPRDLSFADAVELLTSPLPADGSDGHTFDRGYFFKPTPYRHVAMCDGSVRALRMPLDRQAAVALLTANGGEAVDRRWLEYQSTDKLDLGRIWVFSLFVLLALLPGIPPLRPWVWPTVGRSIVLVLCCNLAGSGVAISIS